MRSLIVVLALAFFALYVTSKPVKEVGLPTCTCTSEGEKLSDDRDCHVYYVCNATLSPIPAMCPTGTCYFHNQGTCTNMSSLCLC